MRVIMSMEEIKQKFPHGITKTELAEYYELKIFDTTIPQEIYNKLITNSFNPWGHYVTYYPRYSECNRVSIAGCLFPLTREGEDHMAKVFKEPFTDPRIGNTHED